MEHSFTNRALGVVGDANTRSVTARLPDEVVTFMDSLGPTNLFRNRSEYIQHWAQVGMRVMRDPELTEALDWALDRSVQDTAGEPDGQASACKAEESGSIPEPASEAVATPHEAVVVHPPDPITDALEWARGIGVVPDFLSEEEEANGIYAEVPEEEARPPAIRTEAWRDDPADLNEVGQVRADILETLRSRVH